MKSSRQTRRPTAPKMTSEPLSYSKRWDVQFGYVATVHSTQMLAAYRPKACCVFRWKCTPSTNYVSHVWKSKREKSHPRPQNGFEYMIPSRVASPSTSQAFWWRCARTMVPREQILRQGHSGRIVEPNNFLPCISRKEQGTFIVMQNYVRGVTSPVTTGLPTGEICVFRIISSGYETKS